MKLPRVSLDPEPNDNSRAAAPRVATLRVLRIRQVVQICGLSKATIYRLILRDQFPVPIRLTPTAVGWHENEIAAWISSRARVTADERQHRRRQC